MIQITPESMSTATIELVPGKKKTVSFQSTVLVYPSLHVKDYTREEKVACWLSRREMLCIKSSVRASIQLFYEAYFFSAEETTDGEICTRGLECMLPQDGAKRKQRRKDAISAVLHEQQIQRDNDEHNVELIADVSKKYTGISWSVAQTTAKQDEQFVLDEQGKDTRQLQGDSYCRKTSRSEVLAKSRQGSKRRLTTSGSVVCVH
jgi:hypothetical protein